MKEIGLASVLQQYCQLSDHIAAQVTGSYQIWTDFLTTACADYELWNKRMGRYVRRGVKGIALIDHSGDAPKAAGRKRCRLHTVGKELQSETAFPNADLYGGTQSAG